MDSRTRSDKRKQLEGAEPTTLYVTGKLYTLVGTEAMVLDPETQEWETARQRGELVEDGEANDD